MTPGDEFPLDRDWEGAYLLLESYFKALRIRRPLILSQCVREALTRAAARPDKEGKSTAALAMEEATRLVAEWFQSYLHEPLPESRIAVRGRLALYLADVPGKWQDLFLHRDSSGAEALAQSMRGGYLQAGPAFQTRAMAPLPIQLNPLMELTSHTWEYLDRLPALRRLISILLACLFSFLLILTLWF